MRIWSIHPRYLDWRGLGALWRESLLAQVVLLGHTRGWRNHPQLERFKGHPEPLRAIGFYLVEVHREATKRGYSYDHTKILEPVEEVERIPVTRGQISYEYNLLMSRLEGRTPSKYEENLRGGEEAAPHPLFEIVEGPPESWERSYWRRASRN